MIIATSVIENQSPACFRKSMFAMSTNLEMVYLGLFYDSKKEAMI